MRNIVIIGCGEIAVIKHIPAIQKSEKWNLYGFCNRTPQKAADFAQKYGGKAYASLEEVLLDPMVDAVDICTLLESHCEIAVAALNAGKHVLCEKPMATNEEECRQMIAAAQKNNKKLMIYLNQRLYPAHQKGKELIDAGAIGKIVNYRSFLGYNWDELRYDKEGNYVPKTFHQSPLSGMGIHRVDLMMYLLNAHVTEVCSWGGTLNRRYPDGKLYDCYDNSITILKYENGVVGTLINSWTVYGGEDRTTKIYGTTGTLTMYGEEHELYIDRPDGTREIFDFGRPMPGQYASRIPMVPGVIQVDVVGAFADCIENDTTPLISGEDGLEGMRVIDAMYRSAAEHRWVAL